MEPSSLHAARTRGERRTSVRKQLRFITTLLGAAALALAIAAPATSHQASPTGREHCAAAVEMQVEAGLQAGGGPKAGIDGPANCDHFFFGIGAIGNEHSGGD